MYFYYKMYTICTLFYNTLSPFGELCMSLLTPFTYSSPPATPKNKKGPLYPQMRTEALSTQNKLDFATIILRVSQLLSGLTKLYRNNLIGNSFTRKFVENSYASQKNKSDRNPLTLIAY